MSTQPFAADLEGAAPVPKPTALLRPKRTFPLVSLVCAALVLLYLSRSFTGSAFYHEWFVAPGVVHPVAGLLRAAAAQHELERAGRSQTLHEAYERYLDEHGRLPPRGYDVWFYTSQQTRVCNLNQFDQLYDSLKPFWAVSPREIRARLDVVVHGPALGRVRVRGGKVVRYQALPDAVRGRDSDARRGVEEMLEMVQARFRVKLPDLDMVVNGLDEPRVLMPYAMRTQLEKAADRGSVRSYSNESIPFHELTPDQTTFSLMRATCPPNSPVARARLSISPGESPSTTTGRLSAFTTGIGGFLSEPALEGSTWCTQPELQDLHASFIHPLSFSWVETLAPIFSCSKLTGFNDILVPAWFYWFNHVPYEAEQDVEWKAKTDQVFWRGANTGGKSIGLSWIGWLRSRLVSKLNRPAEWLHSDTMLLASATGELLATTLPTWMLNTVLTDVAFSAPDVHGTLESIQSQRTEPSFRFTGRIPFRDNYRTKAVFDLDGTAYSGRFVALLRSRSAVFKSKLYLETFDSSLVPWFHYIPVSVRLTEVYNLLGYFFSARNVVREIISSGRLPSSLTVEQLKAAIEGVPHEAELKRVAEQGTQWAKECGRREDMASYVHLLALEWSRLCSDERDQAVFVMSEHEGL